MTDADLIIEGSTGDGIGITQHVGDIDGDGLDDIYISGIDSYDGYLFLAASMAGETALLSTDADHVLKGDIDHSLSSTEWCFATGDIDEDGISDLLLSYVFGNRAWLVTGGSLSAGENPLDDATMFEGITGYPVQGWWTSNAGDVDGDRVDDLMVGADGAACLYLSSTTRGASSTPEDADYCFTARDAYYWRLNRGGDLDGDGLEDMLFGDPQNTDLGRVYVVLASSLGTERMIDLKQHADHALVGEVEGDWAGYDSGPLGDIDEDGLGDIWVANSQNNITDEPRRVYVVLGSSLTGTSTLSLTDAHATISSTYLNSDGRSISGAGNYDGDGLPDLLVVTEKGSVFSGSRLAEGGDFDIEDAEVHYSVVGSRVYAGTWLDDLDGDGLSEVLISGAFPGTDPNNNDAWLFLSSSREGLTELTDEDADVLIMSDASPDEDQALSRIVDAGDVDGDGLPDVWFGSYRADLGATDAGIGSLYFGSSLLESSVLMLEDADHTFINTSEYARARWGLTAGDFNGDGLSDLVIGAHNDQAGLGAVYILHAP